MELSIIVMDAFTSSQHLVELTVENFFTEETRRWSLKIENKRTKKQVQAVMHH